jgi:pyruvate,water dikinase
MSDSTVPTSWVADTEPNERFALYSRGNVGEVFPHVITALTGTLIGDAVRQGQLEEFVEMGVLRPCELQGQSLGTGVFCGYLYMNASTMRLFGERMPGMTVSEIDSQVMGDVATPPHHRSKGDRNLLATLRLARYAVSTLRRPNLMPLAAARADAQQWLTTMPSLRDATDAQLLDWLRTFPDRQRASMKRLLHWSGVAGAPRGILDRLLDRPNVPTGIVNRIVSGTGDVDSAQFAQRLWQLGRLVASDEELTHAFDGSLHEISERTRRTALNAGIASFLHDHGHRGNDEYELATHSWSMDPSPVYAAIDRLRHAPNERDPLIANRRLAADAEVALADALRQVPRPLRRMVRRSAQLSRVGAIARERAKDIYVLENLGARRVLHELAHRAHRRGGPADVREAFCVTIDELADFVEDPTAFSELIAQRFEQQRYLNDRMPPLWFQGRIPAPDTWPLRATSLPAAEPGTILTGIAVSGGVASGPARVIHDPNDPRGLEPGDVLVCAITDPSWTPLFLSAAAVVCDSGAVLSHAAIVARELGIPAVLSVPCITAIADGTMLHVDGNAGTVTIG